VSPGRIEEGRSKRVQYTNHKPPRVCSTVAARRRCGLLQYSLAERQWSKNGLCHRDGRFYHAPELYYSRRSHKGNEDEGRFLIIILIGCVTCHIHVTICALSFSTVDSVLPTKGHTAFQFATKRFRSGVQGKTSPLTGMSTPLSFAILTTLPKMASTSIGCPLSRSRSMLGLCQLSGEACKRAVNATVSSTMLEGRPEGESGKPSARPVI
jgi:hypothetical protein